MSKNHNDDKESSEKLEKFINKKRTETSALKKILDFQTKLDEKSKKK